MGKQGPCYHCGVTSTPLWRNGPPEKPVLCNACGSRWRTKGTLANYTPLHARAETDVCEDQRVSRVKNILLNKKKELPLLKRKRNHDNVISRAPDYNQGFQKVVDEDTSNRSSSGSAISNSESCVQIGHGGTDASDMTGWIRFFCTTDFSSIHHFETSIDFIASPDLCWHNQEVDNEMRESEKKYIVE